MFAEFSLQSRVLILLKYAFIKNLFALEYE